MASRDISLLQPEMIQRVRAFLAKAEAQQFPVLIYCTTRTAEDQARLWRQGRDIIEIQGGIERLSEFNKDLGMILRDVGPQKGKRIVTRAMPGQSPHNYGLAVDGCPMRHGRPVWGTKNKADRKVWEQYMALAEEVSLESGGRWPSRKRDYPHIQMPDFRWRNLIVGYGEHVADASVVTRPVIR